MRVLEARHHPTGRISDYLVVGRVRCDEGRATVEPDPRILESPAPQTLLSSLRYVVAMCASRPFEFLRTLNNRFWSFAEVGAEESAGDSRTDSQSRR